MVGGAEDVRDAGPLDLDLVAILDADRAGRRPGLGAMERALAVWMESAGWARPRGRVIVQTREPSNPAVQALVAGNPSRFHHHDLARRVEAGFPAGAPVFRVVGDATLAQELRALRPITLLESPGPERTVCLLAVRPGDVPSFGRAMRDLAVRTVVERVEAEPHL